MSGVVKARVSLDLLLPAGEAKAFEGMSLAQILAKVDHANWIAAPVAKTEPLALGNTELAAHLKGLRASGCSFDDDDVAALTGTGHWWEGIKSLDDMIANKERFLADPGCDFDVEEIEDVISPPKSLRDDRPFQEEGVVVGAYFDRLVAQFAGQDTLTLYREVPVEDVEAFVEAAANASDGGLSEAIDKEEEEVQSAGGHWSLSKDTHCPDSGSGDDVLLTAEADVSDVDWFTTFQAGFSRPWELHVALAGDPRLTEILERNTGVRHDMTAAAGPAPR